MNDGRTSRTMPANAIATASQSRRPTRSPSSGPDSRATKIGAVAPRVAASPTPMLGEESA